LSVSIWYEVPNGKKIPSLLHLICLQ